MGKSKSKKGRKTASKEDDDSFLWIEPSRIRFQHSRIRPVFSGCGRSVESTLKSIRDKEIDPIYDLPPIQVLVGPDNWYFSLNNRRLWVLKQCWREGLLEDKYQNRIRVRVRAPKSQAEVERYTVEKCALEATIMREAKVGKKSLTSDPTSSARVGSTDGNDDDSIHPLLVEGSQNEDDESTDDEAVSNRFSTLILDDDD